MEKGKEVIPYKIGLISTHGTGKTTLVYEVASEFKKRGFNVGIVSEVVREAIEEGIPINNETTLDAQLHILLRHMAKELKATIKGHDVVICDRSVFDNLIYLERKFGRQQFIFDLVINYAKQSPYSALYKIPLVGELEEDGVREGKDKEFQEEVFTKLTDFLQENKIPHVELPSPNTEFRKEWTDWIINDALKVLNPKKQKWQKTL